MSAGAQLVFATRNEGKLRELRDLVGDALEVSSLREHPEAPEVEEDADTFEGNARKKALAAAAGTGLPALADDSGLCVEALGGRPGVYSARYVAGTDRDRYQRLLEELREVPDERRVAAFVCALCLAFPDGRTVVEHGRCEGRIGHAPRGEGGFGYDPVFVVEGKGGRTMAELAPEEKSAISHRGVAFARMRPHLMKLVGG
ncbi:MAG TPA: RdgB/HAM1 family non-canonical purine NTP pyrophosphatase [Myxococcales bacterium]|nr:RdgB/HAM1 family non-canonical purine NTP pyrophosphatase [Myxococcales bacterium]